MTLQETMRGMGDAAREAARRMATVSTRRKNIALRAMAAAVDTRRDLIKTANERDLKAGRQAGLSPALLDRLALTDARIDGIIRGLREVADLPDPVGRCINRRRRPNGLVILKQRVPIGVIGIIYESRPNVTADAAALCLKAGNAVILRGGREALQSNQAIAEALAVGAAEAGLPAQVVQLVTTADREAVRELVQMHDRIDLVIPRGGESLIRAVVEQARVPVIKHYKGVCHVFVDESADPDMALSIIENAKCQRPGVCNALETLLVHAGLASTFLPRLAELALRRRVEIRSDEAARAVVPDFKPAAEADWSAEYLDLILAVRIVADADEAIAHINTYGSHHSDAIVTRDETAAKIFTREVDSAAVYVNASTRFTDGGEFGMGAEMGISTDKLHARGPMGLEELTTYKYVVQGNGQVRA
jgi:glutamate-5-semialdehyde dehydrogenase